jgi:DNA-binding PadR family transcriptional regulator
MTDVHVVLLGLLIKKPLYGYEIKHIIEDHMGDWTDIKFGSIYFALGKLDHEGKVAVDREVKGGKRPARRVYRITDKGREEYFRLLRGLWTRKDRAMYPLDIALFFIDSLPKGEVEEYIRQNIGAYRQALVYIEKHEKEQLSNEHVPRQAKYIFGHSKTHMKAELEWLEKVLADMESG